MKILFIRHGETDVNASGVLHKAHDPEGLNETGRKQASALGEACMRAGVEVIYTSPEKRAVETAEIIGAILGLQSLTIEDFRERNFGEWSGRPWPEMRAELSRMTTEERYTFRPQGGESWKDVEERLSKAIGRITGGESNVVAVISHAGVTRALMPILKNEPKDTSYKYVFDNGSITSFEYKDGKYTGLSVNDTSHLA